VKSYNNEQQLELGGLFLYALTCCIRFWCFFHL